MIRAWVLLCGFCCGAAASKVVAVSRSGNSMHFRLDDGYAEILWMNPSTVRVKQTWRDRPPRGPAAQVERVDWSVFEDDKSVRLRSRDLVAIVAKDPFRVRFEETDGEPLADQELASAGERDEVDYEFLLRDSERLFGLGPESSRLDRRGTVVTTARPLLISSRGYGLYFPGNRGYRFDLGVANPSRLRVTAERSLRSDYIFYFGGSPSQILEHHAEWFGESIEPTRALAGLLAPAEKPTFAFPIEGSPAEALRQVLQSGFSGIPIAAMNPSLVKGLETSFSRDLIAAAMPVVLAASEDAIGPDAIALRRSFESHRLTYLMEARDRGLPPIHSMAHQFPFDETAAPLEDQFFFGDEILVAPFLTPDRRRKVYLPQGLWTDWHTNKVERGRRTIEIFAERPMLPMWMRNGSIVPVDRPGRVELHYFPKLGGEYFLWEPEIDAIAQIHAGPAGDALRLQIEEKTGRTYEWIVHNVSCPAEVARDGKPIQNAAPRTDLASSQWRYDGDRRNLHIRLDARVGEDIVLHVSFPAAAWALQ